MADSIRDLKQAAANSTALHDAEQGQTNANPNNRMAVAGIRSTTWQVMPIDDSAEEEVGGGLVTYTLDPEMENAENANGRHPLGRLST